MADHGRISRVWRWLQGHQLGVVVALAIAASGVWIFIEVAEEVLEDEAHAFDRAIVLAMRDPGDLTDPIGPRWFEEIVRDVTALGGIAVLTIVIIGVIGLLLLRGAIRPAVAIAITAIGAQAISSLLKLAFDRPRPELVPAFAQVYTASFPSGHAMLSAAVYTTFATQLARVLPNATVRGYLLAFALVLVLAIGTSRVYLGVHWPTDVLAGWAAGLTWAALVWIGMRLLVGKRDEPPLPSAR